MKTIAELEQENAALALIVERMREALKAFNGEGPADWPNQDEQGGCVMCGAGAGRASSYASMRHHHHDTCPFRVGEGALALDFPAATERVRKMERVCGAARIKMTKLVHDNEDAGALDNWMTPEDQILYEALSALGGKDEKGEGE